MADITSIRSAYAFFQGKRNVASGLPSAATVSSAPTVPTAPTAPTTAVTTTAFRWPWQTAPAVPGAPTVPTAPTAPVYATPPYVAPTYGQDQFTNSVQNIVNTLEKRIAELEAKLKTANTSSVPTAPVYAPQQQKSPFAWLNGSTATPTYVPSYSTNPYSVQTTQINNQVDQFAYQVTAIGNQLNQAVPQLVNTVQQIGKTFGGLFQSLGIKL